MSQSLQFYIPFFKGLAFLKEAVESVIAQSNPHWTLVVMDDCGPEGGRARDWIASLADERISYLRHEQNKGMVANWNSCLDHASLQVSTSNKHSKHFDLVTLLHDDDRLLPNYVELMLTEHRSTPSAALYFCGAEIIDTNGKPIFSVPDAVKKLIAPRKDSFHLQGSEAFEALFAGCFIMCPTVCYNLTLLGARRFTLGLKQVQDMDFYLRLLDEGFLLKGTSQKAYAYRRHSSNATSLQTASLLRFEEEVALYKAWSSKLVSKGFSRAAAAARHKTIIKLNLLYCIAQDLLSLSPASAATKARFLFNRVLLSRSNTPLESPTI